MFIQHVFVPRTILDAMWGKGSNKILCCLGDYNAVGKEGMLLWVGKTMQMRGDVVTQTKRPGTQ